ncbi:hypothetical protein Tco_0608167 [Tanacetum coccineum]
MKNLVHNIDVLVYSAAYYVIQCYYILDRQIDYQHVVSKQVALDIQGYTRFWFDEKKVFVLFEVLLIFGCILLYVKDYKGLKSTSWKLVMIYGRQKEPRFKGATDVTCGFNFDVVTWKSSFVDIADVIDVLKIVI